MLLGNIQAACLICLIHITATPVQANDIRFDQSNSTIMTLNITQNGVGHKVQGISVNSSLYETTSEAILSGSFDTVSLQQNSASDSKIGLKVNVGLEASSNIFVNFSGISTHSVMLDAVAEELNSVIILDGPGAKSVKATADAAEKSVSHDIRLLGSAIDLTADQQAATDLTVDLYSPSSLLSGLAASVSIIQAGENSAAHIHGTISDSATLVFDQTAVEADHTLEVTLRPFSNLTFNQTTNGFLGGAKVTLDYGQSMTMTQ